MLDPSGYLAPGAKIRIPFHLNEADIDCSVIMMVDHNVVDLALETPDGTLIEAAAAAGLAMDYNVGQRTRSVRFTLPAAVGSGQHAGTWHAVLTIDRKELKRLLPRLRETDPKGFQSLATHGARYCVAVHSYSNLRMTARVEQDRYAPGATLRFGVELSEYGLPVEQRAQVEVQLTRPGGSVITVPMSEVSPGFFEGGAVAGFAGVYHGRVVAKGVTLRGVPFTREQLLSAGVWRGGDVPYQPPHEHAQTDWCSFLACLLGKDNIGQDLERRLREHGLNLDGIRRCARKACGKRAAKRAGR